jgi:hypothetical protein
MNKIAFNDNLDKSGKMFRKKYLESHYPEIFEDVVNYLNNYNLDKLPFKQQVYHWFNDINEYELCYCGKNLKFLQ